MNILLSPTQQSDLETLFIFQLDKQANYLAAFTPKDPGNKPAYLEKWTKILANPAINMQTITVDHLIVGSVIRFEIEGKSEISYWLDRTFWGRGIATSALLSFLKSDQTRPIQGRVAFDNVGSQRVLEKCGFKKTGTDKGFANARQAETEKYSYELT